jgi:hypothetical protein
MDVATFRANFPEFSSTTVFPNTMITFWSGIGERLLIETSWGDLYEHGLQLFTAHKIAIAATNAKSAAAGGIPTGLSGAVSQKSLGDASVSYDTSAAMIEGAGDWNSTEYGRQYISLARLIGAGAVVV